MGNHPGSTSTFGGKRSFSTLLRAAALAVVLVAPLLRAQAPAGRAQAVQLAPTPQWQIDAGGKVEFDVASVKQNAADPSPTSVRANIPLGPMDWFAPTGGLLSVTNYPLFQYLVFAYKLDASQIAAVQSQLPKWASSNRYDIQARASGNPTKDQFRLMTQALLAERFKLILHFETHQVPVMALVLDKPGKLGPNLKLHPADAPCATTPPDPTVGPGATPTVAGGFPQICGGTQYWPSSNGPGRIFMGGRNMSMALLVTSTNMPRFAGTDRPVVDKTGLGGGYDFVAEFAPEVAPGTTNPADPTGLTFLQAFKEQLGLKFEPQTGSANVIVIDHVEEPSLN